LPRKPPLLKEIEKKLEKKSWGDSAVGKPGKKWREKKKAFFSVKER